MGLFPIPSPARRWKGRHKFGNFFSRTLFFFPPQLRHGLPEEQLWRVAARAFNVLVPRGLPALLAHGGRGQREDAWANLAAAFEGFLLAGLPEELACSRLLQQLHDLQSAGPEHAQEGASTAETG